MGSFLRSLFGSKKSNSKIKTRMQSRRLELLGLEERITPAVFSASGQTVIIQLAAGESLTAISASIASGGVVTINATSSLTNTTSPAGSPFTGTGTSTITFTPTSATSFTGISILGSTGTETVAISGAVDLSTNGPTAASFTVGTNLENLTVGGAVSSKDGPINLAATAVTLGANLTTNTSGPIDVSGPVTLSANVLATTNGPITLGTITGAGFNLSTSSGSAPVSLGTITGLGALSITSTGPIGLTGTVGATSVATVGAGAVTLGGAVTTTTGAVTFGGNVTGTGGLAVNSGAAATFSGTVNTSGANQSIVVTSVGDLTFTGTVGNSNAGSVNAKSTAGDVIFGNTVTTSAVGGFTSEATDATKATRIANAVTVGAGANAIVTGNLVTTSNNGGAGIAVDGTATINITGKVDASANGYDLNLAAINGAITIGGAVGSSSTIRMGDLTASGNASFTASGAVTVDQLGLNGSNKFGTSINFAEAVKVGGLIGARVISSGTGTINFAKTIESTVSSASIVLTSVDGALTVSGNIIGKDYVTISSTGSGAITLSGSISTDTANGDIFIESTTGNIVTSGSISTSGIPGGGNSADINIDTVTSGNITIGGNVSTSGGDIFLGADSTSSATGTGNLTINGTVSTAGSFTGDVVIGTGGTGTVTVNQAISSKDGNIFLLAKGNQTNALNFSKDATITAGVGVVFSTTGPANTISLASGANITAVEGVTDDISGTGSLNLASNITVTNSTLPVGIILDNVSINLTGAVSMKTIGVGSDITLASVNGAQNLTLETPAVVGSTITLASVGQTTALNTVTVINSGDVLFNGAFTAANVVLLDTNDAVIFNGQTVISNSLTTTVEAYDVTFNVGQTVVLNGAPVFLNTGDVQFFGTNTVLPSGATIAGGSLADVSLAGTIISGGAFNIGAGLSNIYISNNTQLILNSTMAGSTFASLINLNAGSVGSFNLLGAGTLTLSANSTAGVTTGDIINVTNGTLNVTGTLGSASTITLTNGTLTGPGGTVGILTPAVGTVAPGGTLKTADVTFNAATNYSAAVLTPTTASNLEVGSSNSINLGGATLALSSVASGLAVGSTFTIINNTNSTAITGTFAGLPEGSTVSAKDASGNTVAFTISYVGGTGANDVTLTVASVTPSEPATPQPMVAGQPALNKFTAIGADAGGGPLVTITFANGTYTSFFAYASSFTGGVRVALGDVNGDGSTDVITGAGPGGGPQVNVYSVNTLSGVVTLQSSFFAFSAPFFTGGVYVAAGNANGDFYDDVIVGAGATGGSRVQVYAGSATGVVTSSTLNDFFAYSPAFTGGVVVAAGDRNADFDDEVITAPASNGGYNIKSFDCNGTGNSPIVVDNFFAFNDTTSVGGLSLAVGYFNSGGVADLVVGTSNAGYGVILDSATSGIAGVPFEDFTGAIRAGVAEDSTGQDYAVALAGPTGGPRVSVFSVGATSLTETDNLFVMNPSFTGGLFGTPTLADNVI